MPNFPNYREIIIFMGNLNFKLYNMAMKKFLFGTAALFMMVSCGGGSKDNKQVEDAGLQQFADNFAGLVNAGQLDSIKAIYPTANFDSVASLAGDSISITENGPGDFKINYTSGKWIDVKVDEEGKISVVGSKGIASFPTDKYQTAMSTGMLNDTIDDVNAQELLNDASYFKWLKDKSKKSSDGGLTIKGGKEKMGRVYGEGNYAWTMNCTVTNNYPVKVSGDDYKIAYTLVYAGEESTNWKPSYASRSMKGKDIEPGQTITVTISDRGGGLQKPKIVMNKKIEKSSAQTDQYTGSEYQEYLKSQK